MNIDEQKLRSMVIEVLQELRQDTGRDGVFSCMDEAVKAAKKAYEQLSRLSIEKREKLIAAMRRAVLDNLEELSRLALEETGMGRYEDKLVKNRLAAIKTPGTEDICPRAYTGDHGLTLVERAAYGVIGAITPSTNPSESIICNGIGMIAAGNSVVFNPHPGAVRVSTMTVKILNRAIVAAGGPPDLLTCPKKPDALTGQILMKHPYIRMLVVTGGPEIVRIAMHSGKKVIAAGPGNPPVVVDATADIEKAARDITDGASFDNNILCISEKEVFCEDAVFDRLKEEMKRSGAFEISRGQLAKVMEQITVKREGGIYINKRFVGKDAAYILKHADIEMPPDKKLVIAEVGADHPLVYLEQLMPILPMVRAADVDEAIEMAAAAEQGNFHTAHMHSRNVENLSKMARRIDTSIFVKNGPSYAGLGAQGEGFTTYTIASPTGEGLTSPITFTRQRRCVLKDQFRIV